MFLEYVMVGYFFYRMLISCDDKSTFAVLNVLSCENYQVESSWCLFELLCGFVTQVTLLSTVLVIISVLFLFYILDFLWVLTHFVILHVHLGISPSTIFRVIFLIHQVHCPIFLHCKFSLPLSKTLILYFVLICFEFS